MHQLTGCLAAADCAAEPGNAERIVLDMRNRSCRRAAVCAPVHALPRNGCRGSEWLRKRRWAFLKGVQPVQLVCVAAFFVPASSRLAETHAACFCSVSGQQHHQRAWI